MASSALVAALRIVTVYRITLGFLSARAHSPATPSASAASPGTLPRQHLEDPGSHVSRLGLSPFSRLLLVTLVDLMSSS